MNDLEQFKEYLRNLGWSKGRIHNYAKSLKLQNDLLLARGNRKKLWNARKKAKKFLGEN